MCLIPKIKRDHKPSPTGEWLLFLGMSEDHKAWLLVKREHGEDAEVRSAAFHEDKWFNTWRQERKNEVLDTHAPFERGKEPASP